MRINLDGGLVSDSMTGEKTDIEVLGPWQCGNGNVLWRAVVRCDGDSGGGMAGELRCFWE
jgi:hypothetical protein